MKAYEVIWEPDAENALTDVFLNAIDPNAIWPAQYRADRVLEQRPRTAGGELSEGLWQIVVPPLKLFYEIDDDKKIVTVTFVDTL